MLPKGRRHSEATKVTVNFELGLETVRITVQDNGKGFRLPNEIREFLTQGQLGIVGMQEKARFLDGTFYIRSKLGKGTVVSLEFRA